eukprot:Hpha_TRINITY_DN15724_c7_g1::TRINITY_DN15724_c7_g1_i2::g.40365::m.40365
MAPDGGEECICSATTCGGWIKCHSTSLRGQLRGGAAWWRRWRASFINASLDMHSNMRPQEEKNELGIMDYPPDLLVLPAGGGTTPLGGGEGRVEMVIHLYQELFLY